MGCGDQQCGGTEKCVRVCMYVCLCVCVCVAGCLLPSAPLTATQYSPPPLTTTTATSTAHARSLRGRRSFSLAVS